MNNVNLPDGWSRVTFGKAVQSITERMMPTPEDSRNYIGLEHMQSGSLDLIGVGSEVDLVGAKFRMHKGDVLFARRNPHLRRVSVSPHDGPFSAHGLVLRTRDPLVLLQEFLPFFLQSEEFMSRANQIAVGSLSRTINWKDLSIQEFALPPVEEQQRMVGILAAVNELESSYSALLDSSFLVGSALLERTAATSPMERLGDLVTAIKAGSTPRRLEPAYYGGTIPWLKSGEVDSGRISSTAECVTERALAESSVWLMPVGTIVIAMYGDGKTAGSVGILEKAMACNQAVLGLVADQNRVLPDYLYWVMRRQKESLRNQRAGSSQANLNKEIVGNFRIPVPPLNAQMELLAEVSRLEGLAQFAESAQVAARVLGASLRERLLIGHHV